MNYHLEIIDVNDGREWYAVIYRGDHQHWCSMAKRTKREAEIVGRRWLESFEGKHRDL